MKLIEKLDKPYSEEQRVNFIITQNHNLGYEIRKTETSLEAWGLDDEELLEQQKQQVRGVRNNYLEIFIDSKIKNPFMWDDLTEEDKLELGKYRKYLLDYTKEENWWERNPLTLEEWKYASAATSNVIESEVDEDAMRKEKEVI